MKKIPNPNKMKRIQGPKLTQNELAEAKVRITTYIDKDVLDSLQTRAKKEKSKYQTLLNKILRDFLMNDQNGIEQRLSRLEKAMFK